MASVAVLYYGMGNLRSVAKALEHVAPKARVTLAADARAVAAADRVVFPGQGAMKGCMQALMRDELRAAVLRAARERPFLGICLGLQALYERSEEGGNVAGLGLLPGEVRLFAGAVDAHGAQIVDASKLSTGLWHVRVSWTAHGADYFYDQKLVIGGKST